VSERSGAAAHLKYELVDAVTNIPVKQKSYYGDVSSADNRYWFYLLFNNVFTTKDYYLVVINWELSG